MRINSLKNKISKIEKRMGKENNRLQLSIRKCLAIIDGETAGPPFKNYRNKTNIYIEKICFKYPEESQHLSRLLDDIEDQR